MRWLESVCEAIADHTGHGEEFSGVPCRVERLVRLELEIEVRDDAALPDRSRPNAIDIDGDAHGVAESDDELELAADLLRAAHDTSAIGEKEHRGDVDDAFGGGW